MYPDNDLELIGGVRRPIQCEGLERGHKRTAEVAVSGSVNPQFDWGGLLGSVASTALPLLAGAI
jgi:hypothetical protein